MADSGMVARRMRLADQPASSGAQRFSIVTFYLCGMSADELLSLLPNEFRPFSQLLENRRLSRLLRRETWMLSPEPR